MSSILARGKRLYAKIRDIDGVWRHARTAFFVGQEAAALSWAADREREADCLRNRKPIRLSSLKHATGFSFRPRYPAFETPGKVYAIALIPDIAPFRIKVGYTSGDLEVRLAAFQVVCPTAILIGAWDASAADEKYVLAKLPRRLGKSEVFVCGNVNAFLDEIETALVESR